MFCSLCFFPWLRIFLIFPPLYVGFCTTITGLCGVLVIRSSASRRPTHCVVFANLGQRLVEGCHQRLNALDRFEHQKSFEGSAAAIGAMRKAKHPRFFGSVNMKIGLFGVGKRSSEELHLTLEDLNLKLCSLDLEFSEKTLISSFYS